MNQPTLSSYIIALLELFEAEGRTLKAQIKKVALSLALISVATILLLVGLFFMIWSCYTYLALYFNPPLASLILGSTLIFASILLLVGQRWRH